MGDQRETPPPLQTPSAGEGADSAAVAGTVAASQEPTPPASPENTRASELPTAAHAAHSVQSPLRCCGDEFFPKAKPENRKLARKAFLKLWVAGTVGGLFALFVRSVASDLLRHATWHPNWCYTADLLLRYAYMAWLIVYFLLSNMRLEYETPKGWPALYELVQSLCAFAAALCLGFVLPARDFPVIPSSNWSYAAGSVAIWTLALLATPFGGGGAITTLRWTGVAASTVAFFASVCQPFGPLHLANRVVIVGSVTLLWVLLLSFGHIRICELRESGVSV